MRIGSVLLVIWLIIGAVAAGQRHYFTSSRPSCAKASPQSVNSRSARSTMMSRPPDATAAAALAVPARPCTRPWDSRRHS